MMSGLLAAIASACSRVGGSPSAGCGILENAGIAADHLPVLGLRGREIRLRGLDVGPGAREAGLGLGDVGARDLADLEPVAGGSQLPAQALLVVQGKVEDRLVAPHVGVGGDGGEQDLLFGRDQVGPLGTHLVLGLTHAGRGAAAGIEVLADRERDLLRGAVGALRAVQPATAVGAADIALGGFQPAIEEEARSVAGQRLGHQLVGGAQEGPAGGEVRVGLIGIDERLAQGCGPARGRR